MQMHVTNASMSSSSTMTLHQVTSAPLYMRHHRHQTQPLVALSASFRHHSPRIDALHGVIMQIQPDGELAEVCPRPRVIVDVAEVPTDPSVTTHPIYDGIGLRIFYFNSEWIVSTATRADARDASWASTRSFSDLLCDVFVEITTLPPQADEATLTTRHRELQQVFEERLDKAVVYSVLLLHPEHTWIVHNPSPLAILQDAWNRNTKEYETDPHDSGLWTRVPGPAFLPKGVQWTTPDGHCAKADTPWFKRAQELRMNRKNIGEAYVQQWPDAVPEFYQLFPWGHQVFDWWSFAIGATEHAVYTIHNYRKGNRRHPMPSVQVIGNVDPILSEVDKRARGRKCSMALVKTILYTWPTVDFMRLVGS